MHNTLFTSHFLQPLNKQDWNGPNLRYMVEYKLKEAENDPFKEIETTEEGASYVLVEGVPSYTPYIVTVRAKNGQGMGASTAVTEVYSYQESKSMVEFNSLKISSNFGIKSVQM